MANVNCVAYAQELAGIPSQSQLGAERQGSERFIHDTYTAAALAIGQTIGIGKLKPGEVFLDACITNAALGASSTLALGETASAARFMAAFSTVSAGCNRILSQAGVGWKAAAETELILTVGGGAITGALSVVIRIGNAQ